MQRRIVSAVLAFGVALAVVGLVSRQPDDVRAGDDTDSRIFGNSWSQKRDTDEQTRRRQDLERQYVERLQVKAALLSEEEIREQLDATNLDIRVLEADRTLQSLRQGLERLSNDYQDTPAAEQARRMLDVQNAPDVNDALPVF